MENRAEEKSWLARNWIWLTILVVVGLCLIFVACAVLFGAGIVGSLFGSVKSSGAYQGALARVQEHPKAVEALG